MFVPLSRRNALNIAITLFEHSKRAAGISTVIVPGLVKAGKYEPGDVVGDGANDTWCVVHVDGSWQIVHPLWICLGTYGAEREGRVQIEDDPNLAAKEDLYRKEIKNDVRINDEFFMPRPDVFIYRCFANEEQWHLIPREKTLKSLDEFMALAYISPAFFKLGLTLLSQPFCVQPAIHGVVQIEILAPPHYSHRINMGFKLEYDASNQEADISETFKPSKQQCLLIQKKILNRMVINYRSNDRFVFEVRLPLPGCYKFDILGGLGTDISNLCRFKLISSDFIGEWFINAVEPGIDCWGPGPNAEDVGLLLPSKPSGLLAIQTKCDSGVLRDRSVYHHLTSIQFHINRTMYRKYEFSAEIVPCIFVNDSSIEIHISSSGEVKADTERQKTFSKKSPEEDGEDDFPVRVQISKDHANRQIDMTVIGRMDGGECIVAIKATEMEVRNSLRVPKKNSGTTVCYYLLTANKTVYREVRIEF